MQANPQAMNVETASIDNAQAFWTCVLDEVLTAVETTLCRLSPRELDVDPNNGITETGFKLCIVTAMTVLHPHIHLESEREVEKGRIDLLMCDSGHPEAGRDPSCLALELKYIRLASIMHPLTKYNSAQKFPEKLVKWEKLRRIIMSADLNNLLDTQVKFLAKEDRSGENNSINDLLFEGTCQNIEYCRAIRRDVDSRIGFKSSLMHAVVLGVGSKVLQTPVSEYITGS